MLKSIKTLKFDLLTLTIGILMALVLLRGYHIIFPKISQSLRDIQNLAELGNLNQIAMFLTIFVQFNVASILATAIWAVNQVKKGADVWEACKPFVMYLIFFILLINIALIFLK